MSNAIIEGDSKVHRMSLGVNVIRERLSAVRRAPVKFFRPFELGSIHGYVLGIGPEFFLLAEVDERIRFNGFLCIRLRDVRNLQAPEKHSAFIMKALSLRREKFPTKPRVELTDLPSLLKTASRAFPLVTIHREKVNPDVCHIGRVVDVANGKVSLLEIGPDACWDAKPSVYRLREITRVDFGGGYEDALFLVGGSPVSPS